MFTDDVTCLFFFERWLYTLEVGDVTFGMEKTAVGVVFRFVLEQANMGLFSLIKYQAQFLKGTLESHHRLQPSPTTTRTTAARH